jgi:hypothetical protein
MQRSTSLHGLAALILLASSGEAMKLPHATSPNNAKPGAVVDPSFSRRAALGTLFAGSALVAPTAASAVLDARGNQLGGLNDRTGPLDVMPTPFSSVVDGVRQV